MLAATLVGLLAEFSLTGRWTCGCPPSPSFRSCPSQASPSPRVLVVTLITVGLVCYSASSCSGRAT